MGHHPKCPQWYCNVLFSSCLTLLQPHGLEPARLLCPWDLPRQGSPFPSLGDLPNPGVKPTSPALQVDSLPLSYQGYFNNLSINISSSSWSMTLKCWSVSSVQSLSHVWLFATPWTAAQQTFLSSTNSQSLLKLMSIELVMSFNQLMSPSPPAFNLPQHQGLFQWVSSLHKVAEVLKVEKCWYLPAYSLFSD